MDVVFMSVTSLSLFFQLRVPDSLRHRQTRDAQNGDGTARDLRLCSPNCFLWFYIVFGFRSVFRLKGFVVRIEPSVNATPRITRNKIEKQQLDSNRPKNQKLEQTPVCLQFLNPDKIPQSNYEPCSLLHPWPLVDFLEKPPPAPFTNVSFQTLLQWERRSQFWVLRVGSVNPWVCCWSYHPRCRSCPATTLSERPV